jgi:AraC family transcriptional regulator
MHSEFGACGAVFETTHSSGELLRDHEHGAAYVSIVLDGAYTEVMDDVPSACSGGAVVVHAPGERHADYFRAAARCLNVEITDALAARLPRLVRHDPPVGAAQESLVRTFYGGTAAEQIDAAAASFVAAIEACAAREAAPPAQWLTAALHTFEWIEPVPLGEAARRFGVHQTHFCRAFLHHVGMTPNAYRRRARVELASRLLLTTALPAARVALRCGFADQSHLTRAFAAGAGLSPRAYRRAFAR